MTKPRMDRGALRLFGFAAVLAIALSVAAGGTAHAAISREAALFDRATRIQKIPAKAGDPIGEVTCTWYPGLMIWESGTDNPDPDAATMLPYAGSKRPVCSRTAAPNAIAMKTEGFSLLGRKGPYLVFDATDPNGAVAFMVIAATGGAALFTDGKMESGLKAVTLKGGVLGLHYTRGLNASCSIVQDGAGCWAKLAGDGEIPPLIAKSPPPVKACTAAYRKGPRPAPADDPSIVIYDLDMTLDASGKTQVISQGAVGCAPMP